MRGHGLGIRLGAPAVAVGALAAAAVLATGEHRGDAGSAQANSTVSPGVANLRPPPVTIARHDPGLAPGLIFLGAKDLGGRPGQQGGPLIVDDSGRPVWFRPLPEGQVASDFRVQSYRGRPVLTWWQGRSISGAGHGEGEDVIADSSYRVIARVHAGDGLRADQHAFTLTPQGTALITSYHEVRRDLTSVGGAPDGKVYDGVVQEIDVATGRVLSEWHALDHLRLSDSYLPAPRDPNRPFDPFHINSVSLDGRGNLLISTRHTWAVYDVDRHSGRILWQLGGKRSDFRLGPGLRFAWQHNPVWAGRDTLRIFDNESNGTPVRPQSRVITVRLHPRRRTADLIGSVEYPAGLSVPSQGSSERLPNGDLFVGWGRLGRLSEFGPNGRMLFDAALPPGYDSYRAFRFPWTGRPVTGPVAVARVDGAQTGVDAFWNGATGVARWRLLAGRTRRDLRPVTSAPWDGLDTKLRCPGHPAWLAVAAEAAGGRTIATSAPVQSAG